MDYYMKEYLFPWEEGSRRDIYNVTLTEIKRGKILGLNVKYVNITFNDTRCVLYIPKISVPEYIEYLEIKVYDSDVVLHNILNKLHILSQLRGLSIIVMHREDETYYSPTIYEAIRSKLLILLNEFIPESLEYLKTNFKINWNKKFGKLRCFILDGSHLDYLHIITKINSSLDNLPITLERLHIDYPYFTHPLNNLPPNLKVLTFNNWGSEKYEFALDNLPCTLEILRVPQPYNCYDGITVELDDDVHLDLLSNLPISLKCLSIPWLYREISLDFLPNSLEYLEIDNYMQFNYSMSLSKIPDCLRTINIYGLYDREDMAIIKSKFSNIDIL